MDLSKITLNEAKLTTTTGQKYYQINSSDLKNDKAFSKEPLSEGFIVQYFSDQKGEIEITNDEIDDSNTNRVFTKEVFVKITAKEDDSNWRGTTKIFPIEITLYLLDSNKDDIPDSWAITGYTVINGKIVKWEEGKYDKNQFTKYISDPYKKSTTFDPYSDADKVLGKIDGGILPEARHPLVAAFPNVLLLMEKVSLTKNVNLSIDSETGETKNESKTVSTLTSNSFSDSFTKGIEIAPTSIRGSMSTSFSNENSTTVTLEDSDSKTTSRNWTAGLELNKSEVAFISGSIRYYNNGTAPIYNAVPTVNFVLIGNDPKKDWKTISTIIAKGNTSVYCLLANSIYPEIDQNSIVWNTSDDNNSQPIKLNYKQVQEIAAGKKIQIEIIQISGFYKRYNLNEDISMQESQKWDYIINEIYNNTAGITIIFKNGNSQKRRVAARSELNYDNQSQPEVTLKEAINIAFKDITVEDKSIKHLGKHIYLTSEEGMYADIKTAEKIHSRDKNVSMFDLKLTQGMNIIIKERD